MYSILIRTATLSGLAVSLAGCVAASPTFDATFGQSVTELRAQQTRNPDATMANNGRPVDGIEGRAARESINRYYQSFAEPPLPSNAFTIGIGSGSGDMPSTQR
jgi:hypothetical protein